MENRGQKHQLGIKQAPLMMMHKQEKGCPENYQGGTHRIHAR